MLEHIEYTLLKPEATQLDFENHIERGVKSGVFGICLPPYWVKMAKRNIDKTSNLKIVTVAGFPFGYQKSNVKLNDVSDSIEDGAHEVDIVMNVSAFKTGMITWVKPEIAKASELCHSANVLLKVIIETGYLSEKEIIEASKMCLDAGSDFVKTSTGYAPEGASVKNISLIRQTVGNQCGIKASGGIKSKEFALELINAGADRIGTSSLPEVFN